MASCQRNVSGIGIGLAHWSICLLIFIVINFTFLSIPITAQENQSDAHLPSSDVSDTAEMQQQSPFEITVQVSLVNLFVTVTDKKGRPVSGLTQADFELWEDDVRQDISHFATYENAPLSIAFLLDVSGSMAILNKFQYAVQLIERTVTRLDKKDEASLFCFSDGIVEIKQPFTEQKDNFGVLLEGIQPYGKTALYWAVNIMPKILGKPKNRQAIILLTDGIDNLSKVTLDEMLRNAQQTRVPIYTVEFVTLRGSGKRLPEEYARVAVLRMIAQETGGKYISYTQDKPLPEIISDIVRELRFQYVLGYRSNQTLKPGTYHKIRLKTKRKKHIVRVRKGYIAN